MWIIFAFGSAFFAGMTSILAKCGIKNTDSNTATAIRTIIVLLFSIIMTALTGSWSAISSIGLKTWIFLAASGISTGASWLCYFRALQTGDINKVVPIDKSSTILTIILAAVFLGEKLSLFKVLCTVLMAAGTFLMIKRRASGDSAAAYENKSWAVFAFLSALFAALTSILGKVGVTGIDSNLGTTIRTAVVLVMAWLMVFIERKYSSGHNPKKTELSLTANKRELFFICISGIATGASWLCYFRALQTGPASAVVPIDKLSILVTIAFSRIVFKERLSITALTGLVLLTAGTLAMLLPL